MAGGHEGVYEDGRLAACGVCGRVTHMLDPEEMDWICDPCSTDGWAGTLPVWKLQQGHVVSLKGDGTSELVLRVDHRGRRVSFETRTPGGDYVLRFRAVTRRVYVHERSYPQAAQAFLRAKAS